MKLGDAKPPSRNENVRLEELVDVVKMPNNKWVQIRILPADIVSYKQHWINIIASKTKREVKIPKLCLAHDSETEEMNGTCPYCSIDSQTGTNYLLNVIVRSLQEDAPAKAKVTKAERESGFKDADSDSWTPVRVLRLPSGLMRKIQELKALNKVKGKDGVKTFDVNHEKFGVDLNVKYDENAKGPEKYQVNLAEKAPISDEEKEYLIYDLSPDLIKQMGLETLADAKKELARMQIVGAEEFDSNDEEDDDIGKKKSSKKPAKDFDDDEDDDLATKRGAKKPAAKKSSRDEDDEDDEDDGFDDDDEDDEPAPKRGAKKPVAKKPAAKKSSRDEDAEDDEDDGFDDDEDDEPAPPKRGSKKPAPKKGKDLDDDDDDEGFDDDDEDDEPAPPKRGAKKPAAKKPAAKKSSRDEDDEDDEGFDDEEDEEDDEPAPPKRGAKKPVAKKPPAKKPAKRSRDDDDEDDEDEPF